MFQKIVRTLKWANLAKLINFIRESLRTGFAPQLHWGQDGEDVFLSDTLGSAGFYVDVGAHHPYRFSSTKLLYDRGWSGINIDVTDAILKLFPKYRPRDVNYFGLAGHARKATFYRFVEPALSTIDAELAQERVQSGSELARQEELEVKPLETILEEVDAPETIDLLCVDAEGADFEVLESISFERRVILRVLVELHSPAWSVSEQPISRFLSDRGYRPVAVWRRSTLFELASIDS